MESSKSCLYFITWCNAIGNRIDNSNSNIEQRCFMSLNALRKIINPFILTSAMSK